ncbi:MAG TPA: hypothetical protein IAB53_05810 [Candidatus Scybalocola faecipullorum]|nr:hypothetical protein [Candidatus Scybalocola faecipullorum]
MGEKERLEAFEKMLGAVQRQFEETSEKMERLKAQDKTKSATYRQLMGNRLIYRNMLDLYKLYGLIE